jgi:hypothetical protein
VVSEKPETAALRTATDVSSLLQRTLITRNSPTTDYDIIIDTDYSTGLEAMLIPLAYPDKSAHLRPVPYYRFIS